MHHSKHNAFFTELCTIKSRKVTKQCQRIADANIQPTNQDYWDVGKTVDTLVPI